MSRSERKKELQRRRHRKQKVAFLKSRAARASTSEKKVIADKLRNLTPGAEHLIRHWELEGS